MLAKKSFFVNRSHQTKVGFCLSDVVAMMSGIIQGGGIGPVMFIIYIDDLAKLLEQNGITAKLFADDVKVYLEINDAGDSTCLQKALDIIANWAKYGSCLCQSASVAYLRSVNLVMSMSPTTILANHSCLG